MKRINKIESLSQDLAVLQASIRKIESLLKPTFDQLNVSVKAVSQSIESSTNKFKESVNIDRDQILLIFQALQLQAESAKAIEEHFEQLLSDERLLAVPLHHQVIAGFYEHLMERPLDKIDNATSPIKAKKTAKAGGTGRAKKFNYAAQKEACRNYYLECKSEYKNKTDAAYAIEGKTISGIEITVTPRTIEEYLAGL